MVKTQRGPCEETAGGRECPPPGEKKSSSMGKIEFYKIERDPNWDAIGEP